MDRESPELIEREMEQTRESLTEKVSLLENKVIGQLESATDTAQETVQSVQETVHTLKATVQETVQSVATTVQDTVRSLADGMKEALDVRQQVERHPAAMVGGATALGFVTGLIVFTGRSGGRVPAHTHRATGGMASGAPIAAAPAVSHRPAWLDDLFEMAGREVKKLAEQALSQASASLRRTVETQVPELIEGMVSRATHSHSAPAGARAYERTEFTANGGTCR